ncbi:transcription elongation regulator 1-like [Convolutriloba macropyga]|uniref:transcription elongation regulator 1-like n=1 Tax=Convolutriloba macropyga TaxID=536237 RepID=UPI003F520BB1
MSGDSTVNPGVQLASEGGASIEQAFASSDNANENSVNTIGDHNQSSEASDVRNLGQTINTRNSDTSIPTESNEHTSGHGPDFNSVPNVAALNDSASTSQTESNSQPINNAIPDSTINAAALKVSTSVTQPSNLLPVISTDSIPLSNSSIVAAPQLNLPKVLPQIPLNVLPQPMGALPRPQIPAPDVWVETPAPDGKVYFYHAQTRQTQWTRPQNTTVITQDEFKKMVLTISSTLGPLPFPNVNPGGPSPGAALPPPHFNGPPGGPPPNHPAMLPRFPPPTPAAVQGGPLPPPPHNPFGNPPPNGPPPGMMNLPPPNVPRPAMPPPNFAGAMFPPGGLPPPHQNIPGGPPPPSTFHPPPHHLPPPGPRIPPPNNHPPPPGTVPTPNPAMTPPAVPSLQPPAQSGAPPPGGFPPGQAAPTVAAPKPPLAGTEWAENSTPDGKVYWYNVRTMQTTWTKPKQVEDAERAHKEAEELAKIEEERKKKEENDRIEREAKEAEAKARAKPVASQPIPHSPWCVVFTGDNKVFYYNPSSKLSVWHRPEELVHNRDVDLILTNPPHRSNQPVTSSDNSHSSTSLLNGATSNSSSTGPVLQDTAVLGSGDGTRKNGIDVDDDDESPVAKKKRTEAVAQHVDEARIANLRASIPYETRQQQFMEMLNERSVSAFSTWDKELPKIVFDHRYSLLTAKERKHVFDLFTRNKAEEERKEKSNKIKEKRDQFRSLLEESDITSRMSFSEWLARGWSKDARFKAIEKNRERESMFEEYVTQLRSKEQQTTKSKLGNLKEQFFSLLSEQSYLDETARWSKLRSLIEDDSRYREVPSSSLREQWFNEYIDEVKKNLDPSEVREMERKKRTEESMRLRQAAVAEEREQNNRVITEQRLQHRREESVQRFKALLTDIIKDSEMTWKNGKRQMKKDHRWAGGGLDDKDGSGLLSREDKEQLFNEHIEQLGEKRKQQFREMLDQSEGITFTTGWRDARRKVKEDPRYEKFSSSDRRREREYEAWKETAYMRAKHNFKDLLKETRMITHKSFSMVRQSEQHMHDIEEILKKDKRYLVLNSINQERRKMIMNYLEDVSKRGPPPPPTASDPTRRNLPPLSASLPAAE